MSEKVASVTWKGNLAFQGTAGSGFSVPLGSGPDADGKTDGFSPMELILVALASCTGMDVISILSKKRQEVTHFEVHVQGERREEHPKIFTHILVEYIVTGTNIDPAAVQRAVELSSTKYCSVEAMINKAAQIENKITIRQAEAE